jgi:hypothetical protein
VKKERYQRQFLGIGAAERCNGLGLVKGGYIARLAARWRPGRVVAPLI